MNTVIFRVTADSDESKFIIGHTTMALNKKLNAMINHSLKFDTEDDKFIRRHVAEGINIYLLEKYPCYSIAEVRHHIKGIKDVQKLIRELEQAQRARLEGQDSKCEIEGSRDERSC